MSNKSESAVSSFDTVGGIKERPGAEFIDHLESTKKSDAPDHTTFSRAEKSTNPHIQDEHKLVIEGLEIEYIYGLEPKILDGIWHFQYGITATKNKEKIKGLLLHHTSDSPFDNYLQYMSRRDAKRGGTFGYHFLIGQDGRVAQAAPLTKRTNHVQPSLNRTNALTFTNNNTISISLHSGYREISKGVYEHIPASELQLETAKVVMQALESVFSVPVSNAWGHGEVQSDRMAEEALALAEWGRARTVFT